MLSKTANGSSSSFGVRGASSVNLCANAAAFKGVALIPGVRLADKVGKVNVGRDSKAFPEKKEAAFRFNRERPAILQIRASNSASEWYVGA